MKLYRKAMTAALMLSVSLMMGACQTVGSGTRNVTCETIRFVYLSRKDTKETITQTVGNNGAWVALCGAPPSYKRKL